MTLYFHTSNRLEILAKELADLIKSSSSNPLKPFLVLIQSRGMERWLSMQIALHNGICANMRFLFPNALVYELFKIIMDDIPEDAYLDVEYMKWKLMSLMPAFMEKEEFSFLKKYLREEKKDLSLFQLCSLIADTFDQYIIFRSDMILRWEKGAENHWQAALFRLLIKNTNGLHRAKVAQLFVERLSEKKHRLPSQICVFGVSAIPKFHMDIIYAVSKETDVHLFLMNPCKEYWGDIVSERQIIRKGGKEELHMEKGNPLLSSFGKMGRDFFDIINEYEAIEDFRFEEVEEKSLLSCIQADILNLRDPEYKRKIKEDDLSIQIHCCHSPLREVEVLYDRLLDMFQNDPELKPKDIIVMTPDIEKYAPFIQAVFGAPDPDIKIPFSIADRSPKWENKVVSTFFKILNLKESRFEASKVLDILESEPVARRFKISLDDMELIRTWVKEAGIRWGMDKEDREKIGLSTSIGTWQEGVKSLILGYALLDEADGVFKDIFPYDKVEGKVAELLGRFVDFLDRLFFYVKEFFSKKRLNEWQELLFSMIDELFFIDEETQSYIQLLRDIIGEIVKIGELSGFCEKVDLDVFVWEMESRLSRKGYGSKFLTGGITFCAMLPMRSIPSKVICLLGMNYDSFPRHSKRWEFDLIQKYPRKGDRSKRNDDKYLFLETILSARKTLYISYTGQSIKDNSPVPPSVVVSELLDYIGSKFYIESGDIIEHIFFSHPLHLFNPRNFKDSKKYFSYSKNSMETVQAMIKKRVQPDPFLKQLSLPKQDNWQIEIKDLHEFFSHPCKFLLKRLGIKLPAYEDVVEDVELLKLKGLNKYKFEQELLNSRLSRKEKLMESIQARGLLPLENLGEYEFRKAVYKVDEFIEEMDKYIKKEKKEFELELFINGFSIKGRIKEIYSDTLFLYRFGKIRPYDRIRIWLDYLLAVSYGVSINKAIFMGLDDRERLFFLRFSSLERKKTIEYLKELLDIFKNGLYRPVHFFPASSWKFCESLYIKKEEKDKAIQRARNEWKGNDYSAGEGEDDYYQFCFRGVDPIDEEFVELSKKVFFPIILNSRTEDEGA